MFKIPDDDDEDDEFWKDFPLEEFENLPANKGEKRQGSPLQKSQEEYKKLCTRNIENVPVNSGLCSSILLPISNDNLPLQDVTLPHLAGISQKPGCHSENLATSPGTPENHYTKQQQQTPQSDRCPKRKFPGPAGMLPRLVPGQKLTDTVIKLDGRGDSQLQKNENLLSANPVENFFGENPWLKLVSDLGEDSSRILNSFSIKELHLKACKKQLHQGKVLLLFAILETVDLSSIDASVRLRDRTGSIQGTIHRNLVKEYGEHLQPGTVLVLKQVGVLSPNPRTHYLNITANNLVSLYSTLASGQVTVSAGCSRNGVSVSVSAGDKYRLRADNCPNTNITNPTTTIEDTSNMSDIWQDELTDDILSQLSDDLF
ncbi:Uncharacterized protein C17orf53 [Acanthosepion pharaonis]|uniref:Uncharacterized protein C17orf53 n=1 Tax=Acanthosepion pharaonis TaxID=158019 RepID=A0A812B129_ACAPH|nr:Uncharacterized protein C17orf53 [Sepia pharaonis]